VIVNRPKLGSPLYGQTALNSLVSVTISCRTFSRGLEHRDVNVFRSHEGDGAAFRDGPAALLLPRKITPC
jgi:hypothetical protein